MSTNFDDAMIEKVEQQIEKEQKAVDYDTKEYPVEVIAQKYSEGLEDEDNELFVPDYQRDFVWNEQRQSKFIESLILGLPIPYIFVADNKGRLEIVDGSQRIRTIVAFLENTLVLQGLKKLTYLNKFRFNDLPLARQRRFKRKTIRMIELTEKAEEKVRRDIFERINTGSDELSAMEKRKGIYNGPFYQMVSKCSKIKLFIKLCPIKERKERREEGPEMVLRFFAYAEKYEQFEHSVVDFLSDYMNEMNKKKNFSVEEKHFITMLEFAEKALKFGFRRTPTSKSTPRVRFEALSVGIHLALKINPKLNIPQNLDWMESKEFADLTRSDASNSRIKVKNRIEFVRDKFLNEG